CTPPGGPAGHLAPPGSAGMRVWTQTPPPSPPLPGEGGQDQLFPLLAPPPRLGEGAGGGVRAPTLGGPPGTTQTGAGLPQAVTMAPGGSEDGGPGGVTGKRRPVLLDDRLHDGALEIPVDVAARPLDHEDRNHLFLRIDPEDGAERPVPAVAAVG